MKESIYKITEYTESLKLLIFYLELRSKSLTFAYISNGALLTVVLHYLKTPDHKVVLSFFGLIICITLLALSRRSMFAVDIIAQHIQDIESEMGIGLITKSRSVFIENGLRARWYFIIIYVILILLWLVVLLTNITLKTT